MIWQYDRKECRWSRAAIKKVAQERDYFDAETERKLADEVERFGHAALQKMRLDQPLHAGERRAFALYAATMLMRVPYRRARSLEMIPDALDGVVESVRSELLEAFGENRDSQLLQLMLKSIDALHEKYKTDPPQEVLDSMRSPWPSADVFRRVDEMTWRILEAPITSRGRLTFVTSDNPAYLFEAWGIGSEHSELTLPLSSTFALLGSWKGEKGHTLRVLNAPPAFAKEVNKRIVAGAERFIFCARRESFVEALAAESDPYLSRIDWKPKHS